MQYSFMQCVAKGIEYTYVHTHGHGNTRVFIRIGLICVMEYPDTNR